MKYYVRSTSVEAEEWRPGKSIEGFCECLQPTFYGKHQPHIHTPLGEYMLSPGCMVITDGGGNHYTLNREEFDRMYEKAAS